MTCRKTHKGQDPGSPNLHMHRSPTCKVKNETEFLQQQFALRFLRRVKGCKQSKSEIERWHAEKRICDKQLTRQTQKENERYPQHDVYDQSDNSDTAAGGKDHRERS
jgi:hypothetical protein